MRSPVVHPSPAELEKFHRRQYYAVGFLAIANAWSGPGETFGRDWMREVRIAVAQAFRDAPPVPLFSPPE